MDLSAVPFWVSLFANVTGAVYAGLAYHRNDPKKPAPNTAEFKRQRNIMLLLLGLSWISVLFYYAVPRDPFPSWDQTPLIAGTGLQAPGNQPPTYSVIVNTSLLRKYQDSERLMLISRVNYPNVDLMTDPTIEKSVLYSIYGDSIQLVIPGQGKLKFAVGQLNMVQMIVVMLPNGVGADQISTLADVKKFGGRLLAAPAQVVLVGPSAPNLSSQAAPLHPA